MSISEVGYRETFGFGNDSIVIRHYIAGDKCGKVLNVEGFTEEFIRAGHVIIYNPETEDYKPMPVSDGVYSSLPEGYNYVGVAVSTKSIKEPFIAYMHTGEVNDVASPYPIDDIKDALKEAVPTLVFKHD